MTMTTGKFISQLEALIKKLESLVQSLQCSTSHPSQKQYQILAELGLRLNAGAKNLPIQVAALKTRRAEPSFEEGRKLIAQAQSDRKDLIATAQLTDRVIFARNITYFFDGQRDSVVDSEATKARKQLTRERCERICTLSPDGLIFWAVAFRPTIWTANQMSKDTFDYVFDHIEPDDCLVWPPDIYHILRGLAVEEPLQGYHKYREFLKAAEDDMKKVQSTTQSGKRRRVSDGAASEGESLSSLQTNELVARTPVDQYARTTSPNGTSVVLANNQVAVYGKGKSGNQVHKHHNVDQQQRAGESISNTLRLERTATPPMTTQDSLQGLEDQQLDAAPAGVGTTLLRGIQFEKHTLHQIVIDSPTSILGGIWFGSPPGFQPFVSLRLSRALSDVIKLSGQEVLVPEPALDVNRTFTGVYSVKLECFRQLIQRDGFGAILWNECEEEAFVTMQVINEELIADFIQISQAAIGVLPMLDTISTSSSA